MKPQPVANAFLLCDSVSRDARTGKTSLFGIFNMIWVQQTPTVHPFLAIYACLTEAKGEYEVWVEVVHVPTNQRVARFPTTEQPPLLIKADSPLAPLDYVELVFEVRNLPLQELGEYEFRLFVDGRITALRRLWVASLAEAPEPLKEVLGG